MLTYNSCVPILTPVGWRSNLALGREPKMLSNPSGKYRPAPCFELVNRQWSSKTLETAPAWCSVDLRNGNQALVEPMSIQRRKAMFDLLVSIGFKESEVGFPPASQIDFDFCLEHIEKN